MTDKEKCQVIAKKKDCRDFRCNECPLVRGKWNCSKAKYVHQAAIQWLKDHPDECEAKGEEKAMEKTEMMKRYEAETGKPGSESAEHLSEDIETVDYVRWLETKASAYDRIMSGGKKTMKDLANILGRVVVVNANGDIESFAGEPRIDLHYGFWYLNEDDEDYEDYRFFIPKDIVDFNGDWTTSLTLPDKWEQPCSKN